MALTQLFNVSHKQDMKVCFTITAAIWSYRKESNQTCECTQNILKILNSVLFSICCTKGAVTMAKTGAGPYTPRFNEWINSAPGWCLHMCVYLSDWGKKKKKKRDKDGENEHQNWCVRLRVYTCVTDGGTKWGWKTGKAKGGSFVCVRLLAGWNSSLFKSGLQHHKMSN